MTRRLIVLKTVLWALVGMLAAITAVRFWHGLGAVTNLSDFAPWGFWVGFDVMAGVALAAGGFVIAATVYIFHLEEYRRFVRPAILTAWLGYIAVAVGLLYDLGLPWHIWHPAIYPQHHSVLFEVAMCVMLYLGVLTLEFAPAVLEHPPFAHPWFDKALGIMKKVTIPLVVAGIVLSTLHQSSLGSLFLITPYRLHPLWYSPIIYVLFFISAVGLGLMTVVLESLLAAYFLHHPIPRKLLGGLGLAAALVLGLYVILRFGDLAARGVLTATLDGSWPSMLFISEVGISAVIPALLLLSKRVRSSVTGLATCAGMAVLGMVWYRLDVCFIAIARPEGFSYYPRWTEVAVSLGIVAAGTLVFLFFVEHVRVYEDEGPQPSAPNERRDTVAVHRLLPDRHAAPRRYSLAAVAAAVITVPLLPVRGAQPIRTPTQPPRTLAGLAMERDDVSGRYLALLAELSSPAVDTMLRQLLTIDGNRDGTLVLFDHEAHVEREGDAVSCTQCHHLNLPFDRASSCYECHRDMYETTSLFDHSLHVQATHGSDGCSQCHANTDGPKTYASATGCSDCHDVEVAAHPVIEPPGERWNDAVSYLDAMHGLCVTCHERRLQRSPEDLPAQLAECAACHDADRATEIKQLAPQRKGSGMFAVGNR